MEASRDLGGNVLNLACGKRKEGRKTQLRGDRGEKKDSGIRLACGKQTAAT
jgi:hypothetical protein